MMFCTKYSGSLRQVATVGLVLMGALQLSTAMAQSSAPVAADKNEAVGTFKSRKEAVSYAIGVTTARNLAKDGVEIDTSLVLKGLNDAQGNGRLAMSEKEIRSVMASLVGDMRKQMAANRKDAEEVNKKKGDDFRTNFAKQADVNTLPNGVLYKVAKAGTGPRPTDEDNIVVNYRGTLISGYEFDANPEGRPATLKLSQLIVGWKESIKLMPTGSRWTIVVPPQLAYGQRGVGADIGPNETLVFDVELLAVTR